MVVILMNHFDLHKIYLLKGEHNLSVFFQWLLQLTGLWSKTLKYPFSNID